MKRSAFISGAGMLAGGVLAPGISALATTPEAAVIKPRYLKAGDTIAITSPAGYISLDEIRPAVALLRQWGFNVRVGDTVGKRDCSFGGTDAERAMDLQILLDDPHVHAILCARGGYGITRILDRIDFDRLRLKPKWIIGFSDVTALHLHISGDEPVASIHSKMCNSFPEQWEKADPIVQETILSIRDAITGRHMSYSAMPHSRNRVGVGDGILVGGNLAVIQNCMGTASEIRTQNRILFLEEVGEYPYSLDRMLTNLLRSGKLDRLRGLVVGGFNRIKADDPGEEFGRSLEDMVMEKVAGFGYPVCFNFPVGHQKNNYALKCGFMHRLVVAEDVVRLEEKPV